MAVTTERSTILQTQEGTLTAALGYTKFNRRVGVQAFDFTQGAAAGDATSTMGLVKMPPGKHTLLGIVVWTSAFGSSRVLDFGYEAHTKTDGTTAVTLSANAFKNDLDVASATTAITPTSIPLVKEMDSQNGYVLNATVAGGTIPAAATITGYVLYAY